MIEIFQGFLHKISYSFERNTKQIQNIKSHVYYLNTLNNQSQVFRNNIRGKMDRIPLQKDILYGPVRSRRLGTSLGVNLSPKSKKICSFDCVYCQYGPTETKLVEYNHENVPRPVEVEEKLEKALRKINNELSYITFSGNGEPTLHPDFPEIVERTKKVRDKYSNVKIALLSNSSRIGEREILKTINKIDFPIMKLDVGSEDKFIEINRPFKIKYGEIVEALKKVDRLCIQSIKFKGEFSNVDEDLENWIEVVSKINPREVQLYTLDRPTHRKLEKVSDKKLTEIKEVLEKKGIETIIY